MIERVDRLVPYGHNDAQISTFHAFGDRLLREHALEAGLSDQSDRPRAAPSRSSSCASTLSSCRSTDTARSATRRASCRRW